MKSETQLCLSFTYLLGRRTFYLFFFPFKQIKNIAIDAGYDGLEWTPNNTLAGKQLEMGLVSRQDLTIIKSGHQSFRRDKNLLQAWRRLNKKFSVPSYFYFPEERASLDNLEKIQKILGRKLDVVLYSPHLQEESGTKRPFGEKLIQPTSHLMEQWQVQNTNEFVLEAQKRGYTGFALDLFHFRAPSSGHTSLHPWSKTLPQLLPFTKEIHVSAGRVDIPGSSIPTMAELQDLLEGTEKTDLLKMLKVIKSSGWKGRVVTEIPSVALGVWSPKGLIEKHKRIVRTIRRYLTS